LPLIINRFDANLRIEFHVSEAVKQLSEDWKRRFDDLSCKYEAERESLVSIFHDSRRVFCEFLSKKCRDEIDRSVERAKADTIREMEEKCASFIDDELAQQQIIFQESMKVTLNNLNANDRDKMNELRNQCLKAMDVQSHLMMCRQITELVHTTSVEKHHWQRRLGAMREEYEFKVITLQMRLNSLVGEILREHQSKSIIIALWLSFFKSLSAIDVNQLTQHERRMFFDFQQIQCELVENSEDSSSRIFKVEEKEKMDKKSLDGDDDDDDSNWMKNIDECNLKWKENGVKDSSVILNWRQSPVENISTTAQDAFMSSIFHRTSQTDCDYSMISNTASFIIALVRRSTNVNQLTETIVEILRNLLKSLELSTAESFVPMKKVDPLHIRDSKEIIEKRIS
jgi:hypothetical protein